MRNDADNEVEGHVLLRNKPDPGGAVAHGAMLFLISIFFIPLTVSLWEGDIVVAIGWEDLFILVMFQLLPGWLLVLLVSALHWDLFGGETVYYSPSAIYIQQKRLFRRELVIPWDFMMEIKPYSESPLLFAIPTHNPTICATYRTSSGKTKTIRFGFNLNNKQQTFVVERIRELLVENFA
ncbi:MAG: hypothetical protein IKN78_12490 [Bacteroidales bacterium]|nr:hypothetical protein [Bacteroidales bacterium]